MVLSAWFSFKSVFPLLNRELLVYHIAAAKIQALGRFFFIIFWPVSCERISPKMV